MISRNRQTKLYIYVCDFILVFVLYLFYNSDGVKKTQMIQFVNKKILLRLIESELS